MTASARAGWLVAVAFAAALVLVRFRPSRVVRDDPPDLSSISVPIEHAAAESGVDADLLRALVATESGGDRHARSGAGAVGLLQLMPDAADESAKALGMRRPPDLEDPATNLRLGARHLARMLAALDGDVPLALAAYNAGLARAQRWRLRAPDVDGLGVVSREGFAETRGHVLRTLRFLDTYSKR